MVVLVGLADVVVVVDDEIVVDSVAEVVGVVLVGFMLVVVLVGLVDIAVVVDVEIVVVLVAVVVGVLLVGLVVVSLVVVVVVSVIYLIQGQPSYEMLQSLLISLVTAFFYYQ